MEHDPLGAGYEVHSVHYAYFNGTSWQNRVVISDSTEERSWWAESFGSLQLAVETGVEVHLTSSIGSTKEVLLIISGIGIKQMEIGK